MRFNLRTLLLLVAIAAIATPIALRYLRQDILAPVPVSVLEKLDSRFDRLNKSMNFDQMFATLGLARYKTHLESSAISHGGMSGWRTLYRFSNDDYSLETVEYMDGRTACVLKTPQHPNQRETDLKTGDSPLDP